LISLYFATELPVMICASVEVCSWILENFQRRHK